MCECRSRVLTLTWILVATAASGLLSLCAAAWLSFGLMAALVKRLVSLSAGLLLATSILHLLPEALDSGIDHHRLAWTLLAGLVAFFLLEKGAILRHSHHHEGDGHAHHHGHDRDEAGAGGWLILVGDSVHNFADGVLLAAAFMADTQLGWITAAAIAAHEIPQEVGDFIVLLNAGYSRARAFAYNTVASLAAVAGGVAGYFWLQRAQGILPHVLVLAASGFIYIALADLIPSMQRDGSRRESALQLALMGCGIVAIALLTAQLHAH